MPSTNLVDPRTHALLEVMHYKSDALREGSLYAIKRARVESANYIGRGGLHIYILFSCDNPCYLKLVLGPL